MSFPFRPLCVLALCLLPATPLMSALVPGAALAAPSPGSIMPQQGAAYDDLVNQTMPPPSMQEGREGYIGTHVDPATGDVITDVVSPRMPQQQQQQVPIYIQPRIDAYEGEIYPGVQPGVQPGMRPGSRPGGHMGGHQGGHWQQGSHNTQRPHSNRGNQGHGPRQPGHGVTHPGQFQSGQAQSGHAGGQHGTPHISGNNVQHPGYIQPGGNPGNMGHYMPQGRR